MLLIAEEQRWTGDDAERAGVRLPSQSAGILKRNFWISSFYFLAMEVVDPRSYHGFCLRGEGRANFVISSKCDKNGLR